MDSEHSQSEPLNPPPPPGLAARFLVGAIRVYQAVGSPIFGKHCRFHPTCSHYGVEAIQRHGALRGSWLTMRRLAKCHPFGSGGWDPVPDRDEPCEADR